MFSSAPPRKVLALVCGGGGLNFRKEALDIFQSGKSRGRRKGGKTLQIGPKGRKKSSLSSVLPIRLQRQGGGAIVSQRFKNCFYPAARRGFMSDLHFRGQNRELNEITDWYQSRFKTTENSTPDFETFPLFLC